MLVYKSVAYSIGFKSRLKKKTIDSSRKLFGKPDMSCSYMKIMRKNIFRWVIRTSQRVIGNYYVCKRKYDILNLLSII